MHVTAQMISTFVFAIWIVQFLFYLNPKFQASGFLLPLYRPICVFSPRRFSRLAAQIKTEEQHHKKACLKSYQQCQTQACIATDKSFFRNWFEKESTTCEANLSNSAYQLKSYCTADLCVSSHMQNADDVRQIK